MAEEVEKTEVDEAPVAVEEAPEASETHDEPAPNEFDELAEAGEVDVAAMALDAPKGFTEARVYLCERGHRTMTLWGDPPDACQAHPTRHGGVCGLPIYHLTALPDQVQKALNPLKASKKKAGKK